MSMRPLTVITHFYNEEFLLPHWLRHHARLFDHGVLIDYASTDRSVEICQELAPHWEVRSSCNARFGAAEADCEAMDIEREFDGWKMVLNATEFLFHPDFRGYIRDLESELPVVGCFATRCAIMCDVSTSSEDILADEPLVLQKHHGYVDYERGIRRFRYFHRFPDGRYATGRHATKHRAQFRDDILVLWFGWSPWVETLKARKLQIQTRMPERDKVLGFGVQHVVTAEELENRFQANRAISYDLLTDPIYRNLYERTRGAMGLLTQATAETHSRAVGDD